MFNRTTIDAGIPPAAIQCDSYNDDPVRVDRVARRMPSSTTIERIASELKVFGDPIRLQILVALSKEPLCVCELAVLLKMSLPAVSHHLKVLLNSKFLETTRQGKFVCYSVSTAAAGGSLGSILELCDVHLQRGVA